MPMRKRVSISRRAPVEEAEIDLRRCGGEDVEDRTLLHAVAAPRPSQTQDRHRPRERRQQCALGVAELDLSPKVAPALAMILNKW